MIRLLNPNAGNAEQKEKTVIIVVSLRITQKAHGTARQKRCAVSVVRMIV